MGTCVTGETDLDRRREEGDSSVRTKNFTVKSSVKEEFRKKQGLHVRYKSVTGKSTQH